MTIVPGFQCLLLINRASKVLVLVGEGRLS